MFTAEEVSTIIEIENASAKRGSYTERERKEIVKILDGKNLTQEDGLLHYYQWAFEKS